MSETLEFPLLTEHLVAASGPSKETAIATVQSVALAPFVAIESQLRTLAERYRAVVFDPSTPAGLEAMRKARQDLRENGRFAVQRALDGTKRVLNDTKGDIEELAKSLIAINRPREDEIHEVIEAREAAIKAAKEAEAARLAKIEAERVAKHEAGIATIRGYVAQAAGKTHAQIEAGLDALAGVTIGDSWEEFRDRAQTALDQARAALRAMSDAAFLAEKEAAKREAQRIEQARVAAEQRAEAERLQAEARRMAERLADETAMFEKRKAEFEARLMASEKAYAAAVLSAAATTAPPAAKPAAPATQAAEAAIEAPAAVLSDKPVADAQAIAWVDSLPAAADPRPPINVGEIARRLGFNLPSAFVVETLGVPTVEIPERKGVYWTAAQWPRIKVKLVAHVPGLE